MNERESLLRDTNKDMEKLSDDELRIVAKMVGRFAAGQKLYGRFSADTDVQPRQLLAAMECADGLFYLGARLLQDGFKTLSPQELAFQIDRLSEQERAVVSIIVGNAEAGESSIGKLNVSTDDRDFVGEAFEEFCDAAIELGMYVEKQAVNNA